MRIKIIHTILLTGILTLKGYSFPEGTGPGEDPPLSSLPVSSLPVSSLPDSYNESYALFTDRSMYAVGEKILFSVFNTSPPALQDACWSRVIYVHLLKADGTPVVQDKFPMECSGTSGVLSIPDEVLTGYYYLCAYTKWMRNFSPAYFSFVPLTIINPFNPQLDRSGLPVPDRTHPPDTFPPEMSPEPGIVPGPTDFPGSGKEALQELECIPDKAVYRPGEEIHLSLHYPGSSEKTDGRICISVTGEDSGDTLVHHDIHPEADGSWSNPAYLYLPEIQGLSLSGRILAGDPPEGIINARVEMSIFGNRPSFRSYNTNPDGSFYFCMDSFTGIHEMFIAASHSEHPDLELRIDNDFASPHIRFPAKPFHLNQEERRSARDILLNMQLEKLFHLPDSSVDQEPLPAPGNTSVKGLQTRKLRVDDYIELPNLKEVLIELVPEVMPKTRRGETSLIFSGNELTSNIISGFDPLILVDHVPVYDLDKLLALEPKRIRSIEVVNEVYVVGNSSYGGFINILSKNGDMGGIDLPENSLFFRYQGYRKMQGGESLYRIQEGIPRTDDTDPEGRGMELRNCLYWDPNLSLAPGQKADIRFYSTDQPGSYRMIVRGIAGDGRYLYGQCKFRIAPGTGR